jgi:hypothetical protein
MCSPFKTFRKNQGYTMENLLLPYFKLQDRVERHHQHRPAFGPGLRFVSLPIDPATPTHATSSFAAGAGAAIRLRSGCAAHWCNNS